MSINIPNTIAQIGAQREKEMREAAQRKQFDQIAREVQVTPITPYPLGGPVPVAGIGDIASEAKGSAARFNTGKPALDLIPLRIIHAHMRGACIHDARVLDALLNLAEFQEGGDAMGLQCAIDAIGPAWDECAAVFEYGKRKYAAWNWAKGMPWSAVIASAARHLIYGILAGEDVDKESGLPHRGHFLCNMVMLLTYVRTYPEGDDRPSQWLSVASKTQES